MRLDYFAWRGSGINIIVPATVKPFCFVVCQLDNNQKAIILKMKTAVAVVFLLCAVAISEAQNHASWGIVGPNDFRAHYEIVKKSSSFAQVVTKDASFPQVTLI